MIRPEPFQFFTPPLTTRRSNQPLRSPASSPNLSIRSTVSSPPTIKIEDSIFEAPNGVLDNQQSAGLPDNTETASSPQKIYQLPPVNAWVPKGESMFASILDQRSPQIYRKTNISTTKTASYPPTVQASSAIQSSRVSWPQESQMLQTAEPISSARSAHSDEASKSSPPASRSPRLLRKCTSFDLERSKPFPTRSTMKSPVSVRKGINLEKAESLHEDMIVTNSSSQLADDSDKKHVLHFPKVDEVEIRDASVSKAPFCHSLAESNMYFSTLDSSLSNAEVKCTPSSEVLGEKMAINDQTKQNKSFERPTFSLPNDNDSPELNVKSKSIGEENDIDEDKSVELQDADRSSEADGQVQTSQIVTASASHKSKSDKPLKEVGGAKKKILVGKHPLKGKSKAGEKSAKSPDKSGHAEKGHTKTPASTVKTAIMSSAAKLKSIGSRSPVTLLSYKSKSISIPDQSRKSGRPVSASELGPDLKNKQQKIHQTESSPTVLVAKLEEKEIYEERKDAQQIHSMIKSDPSLNVKPETSKVKAVASGSLSASGLASKKVMSDRKGLKLPSTDKKERTASGSKTPVDKVVKASQSKLGAKDRSAQSLKTSQSGGKSPVTVAPKAVPESSSISKKKSLVKPEMPTAKTDKAKPKQAKRGSISSDSVKPSDHFRDCCHGRRKTEKK